MEAASGDDAMEGLAKGEVRELGGGFEEGGEGEGVGMEAEAEHLEEEAEGLGGLGFPDVAGDNGGPGDDIFEGKPVEESAGLGEVWGEFEV